MRAALFDAEGVPRKDMVGTPAFFNRNLKPGWTWREIPVDIVSLENMPALASLPAHPDLVEPE